MSRAPHDKPPQDPTRHQPPSLQGHSVPEDRLAAILPLAQSLGAAARSFSDALPFEADPADFVRVLEAEPEA